MICYVNFSKKKKNKGNETEKNKGIETVCLLGPTRDDGDVVPFITLKWMASR